MKLFLILATAATLAAAGSRSYRSEASRFRDAERRANLDYEDIQTGDQDQVERFDEPTERSERKQSRSGLYSSHHSIQVSKAKAQRRHSKGASAKDSEASGTQFEGAHYGTYGAPQVQQIHTHELLTSQGLVPFYQSPSGHAPGNIVLTGGLGVTGNADAGAHGPLLLYGGAGAGSHGQPLVIGGPGAGSHGQLLVNPGAGHHGQLLLTGGPGTGHPAGIIANTAAGVGPGENDLGTDITKSVYVFSAPPDPFDYAPRQTISKIPQRPQKHYQVLFINAPSPPPPQQHHVELPHPPELKTLVYVLVKKPERPPPINFIKTPTPQHQHKPEVFFIRYKNRGYGLSPSPVGPVEEQLPVGHPGVSFAPIAHHPHEELRGNVDYGPLQGQYGQPAPYDLEEYQDDSHLSASSVHSQRGSAREVDAGVTGI